MRYYVLSDHMHHVFCSYYLTCFYFKKKNPQHYDVDRIPISQTPHHLIGVTAEVHRDLTPSPKLPQPVRDNTQIFPSADLHNCNSQVFLVFRDASQ